jgi:hypothetical protein
MNVRGEEGHHVADCELRKALNKVKADFKKKRAESGIISKDSEFSKQVKECVAELAREREQNKYVPKEPDKDHKIAAFTWANEYQEDLMYQGPYGL